MHVRELWVTDFRSWKSCELPLETGVTVLCGRNGVGKTNLVEAVGYLATLSSHRVAGDASLIRRGRDSALIRAAIISDGRELLLEAQLQTGRANRARINRSPLPRMRDLLGVLRVVVFAPEDLALVRGDPTERRRFIDEALLMYSPRMAGVRSDYDRILKQRNALLKSSYGARDSVLTTLDVWDEQLATCGAELTAARWELVVGLRPHFTTSYSELAPVGALANLRYRTALTDNDGPEEPVPSVSELRERMLVALAARRRAELERGVTLVGPHRDEVDISLGDGPARGYASHGESWSLALALRLATFAYMRADSINPVLVLDDVFAELDTGRRDQLARLAGAAEQVLITAAVAADVPEPLRARILGVTADSDGAPQVTDWPTT